MFGLDRCEAKHEATEILPHCNQLLSHLVEIFLLGVELILYVRSSAAHLIEAYLQELTVSQVTQVLFS